MKQNFYIETEPKKRKNHWVVSTFLANGNGGSMLDSELSFKTKRDAKLYIDGWLDCLQYFQLHG